MTICICLTKKYYKYNQSYHNISQPDFHHNTMVQSDGWLVLHSHMPEDAGKCSI
jgi:hypothetical protein